MFFEIIEIFYGLITGTFLYWPIHLILFVIIAYFVRGHYARKYRPYTEGLTRDKVKVSVVIPEYHENLDILEKVIKSAVENKPDEVILVYEEDGKEIEELIKKYKIKGVKIPNLISGDKRLGKRASLALAWLIAKGDIIIHIDSDTILAPNAIDEIIKPFADPKVVGVQGHPVLFRTGERLPYLLGQIIELSRDTVCRMLNGFEVVIDSKIAAYRRDFLIKNINNFLLESWGGKRVQIADDRSLTFLANYEGYKTVYQSTAYGYSAAQPTLVKFLYQQLRWARGSYLYLIKDIKTGLFFKAPRLYRFQELTYLLSPVSFTIAWVQTLLANVRVVDVAASNIYYYTGIYIPGILLSLVIFLVGLGFLVDFTLKALNVDENELKKLSISFLEYVAMGLIGLFLLYPLMIYAMLTYKNATSWLSR